MRIAFYKGRKRFFNRFVAWWTAGPFSHAEAILDDSWGGIGPVLCGSSSFMDGGVRLKVIDLDPLHWDVMDVPFMDARRVHQWFVDHRGMRYDLVGLLSTSFPIQHGWNRYFCNEAIGEAGGVVEAWRFDPNGFARLCELLPGSRWIHGWHVRPG
jgi:hypothetical protein